MIEKLKESYGEWIDEKGVTWQSKKSYLQCDVLGLCGCGNPDDVMAYIKEMLNKIKNKDFGLYSDLPYMFFTYWASEKGFTVHGITVRCSFLTDKGKELLADIELLEVETK